MTAATPSDSVAVIGFLLAWCAGDALAVVELRFIGDLNEDEIAEALQVSVKTVKRNWQVAKSWRFNFLSGEHP